MLIVRLFVDCVSSSLFSTKQWVVTAAMESPGQQVNKGREEGECWERGGGGTGDALGLCVVSGGHGPLEDAYENVCPKSVPLCKHEMIDNPLTY